VKVFYTWINTKITGYLADHITLFNLVPGEQLIKQKYPLTGVFSDA